MGFHLFNNMGKLRFFSPNDHRIDWQEIQKRGKKKRLRDISTIMGASKFLVLAMSGPYKKGQRVAWI